MAIKYKKLISDYCAANAISIPPGFGRNTPGHLAIVRRHLTPQKLIATTWSKVSDVLYFIETQLTPELGEAVGASIQILNFQTGEILAYSESKQLRSVATI